MQNQLTSKFPQVIQIQQNTLYMVDIMFLNHVQIGQCESAVIFNILM